MLVLHEDLQGPSHIGCGLSNYGVVATAKRAKTAGRGTESYLVSCPGYSLWQALRGRRGREV